MVKYGECGSTSAHIEGSVFQFSEGVVNYVDPTTSSNAMNTFVGSKDHVRIPIGKALILESVPKPCGSTCRPQGGRSKTRPRVQHQYKR